MTRVLVVEDDVILSSAYKMNFANANLDTVVVHDVASAMNEIEKQAPDVIILDLVLPGQDGFFMLEQLKKNEKWKDIPVLVASNIGTEQNVARAKELGAADFIIKSDISMNQLIEKVESLAS